MGIDINALIPADKQGKIAEFLNFVGGIRENKVTSDAEYGNVGELTRKIAGMISGLEEDRKALVFPFKEKAAAIDERYRVVRRELQGGQDALKRSMSEWYAQRERERIEAQRKAELEAAEARRIAEEKAAREAAKAEALLAAGKEAQAEKAEARAEAAQLKAAAIVAPVVESAAKAEGISYRKTWNVVVESHEKAVKGLAGNDAFLDCLTIDIAELKRRVAAFGGKLPLPDGLRVVEENIVAVRGKR